MGRKPKIHLEDPIFVKEVIKTTIQNLSKILESPESAHHAETVANSMVKLMSELLRPQVDELRATFTNQTQRIQVLEEQVTALYSMMGMRGLTQNGPAPRRAPAWPQAPQPFPQGQGIPPVYQGPSSEEIARARA